MLRNKIYKIIQAVFPKSGLQRLKKFYRQDFATARGRGFTLMELIVVVAIMAIMASLFVLNLSGQRLPRDIRIAENQLVTNIKQIQSFTLSSRTLSSGQTVQYYLLKFNLSKPSQYTIEAMYNVSSGRPQVQDVQTITLPANLRFAAANPISIARSVNPATQPAASGCALLAFSVPFAKVFFNDGCVITNPPGGVDTTNQNDDYGKIVNFVSNVSCNGGTYSYPPSPPACTLSTDSIMTITLTDVNNTISKTVIINGITGAITFN